MTCGVCKMWNDVGNNEVGKFRGWLQEKKGYSFTTARMYDEAMRTVEQEHLTTESVGDIYWNAPHHRRTKLRHAVRMLDEYYG